MPTHDTARSWAILLYQLLIGAACCIAISAILLPWYHQSIIVGLTPSDPKYSAKLFYQAFYLYSAPQCENSTSCPAAFTQLFIVDVPGINGLTWWDLTKNTPGVQELYSTRWLFFTVWIFQAVTLISLPASLFRGGQSNLTCVVSLIAGGSSVLIFFFLPDTLLGDYGSNCTSREGAFSPYLTSTTPCDTFLSSSSLSNNLGITESSWGPAIGFYCACINMVLEMVIYVLSTFLHPCVLSRPRTTMEWDDDDPDDIILDSDDHLIGTGSSSLLASSYGSINQSATYS